MTTRSYLLDATEEVWNVISYTEEHVMCFTEVIHHADTNTIEYTVQLRAEDVSWLEDLLAPIVQAGHWRAHDPCARCLLYHEATHFVKRKFA